MLDPRVEACREYWESLRMREQAIEAIEHETPEQETGPNGDYVVGCLK